MTIVEKLRALLLDFLSPVMREPHPNPLLGKEREKDVPHPGPLLGKEREQGGVPGAGPLTTGIVTFIIGALVTGYLFVTNAEGKQKEIYWFVNTGLCLWPGLMAMLFVLRHEPADYGLQRGDARYGLRLSLALWLGMLVVAGIASTLPSFRNYYVHNMLGAWLNGVGPVYDGISVHIPALVYYELAMGFYMFCWEFFFRGFLLFGFAKTRLGPLGAVILQSIPFVLLHWSYNAGASKPSPEVLGSAIAGPILGILALRTRSFIYGFLCHWAVSLTFDLMILAPFIIRHSG